MKLTKYKLKQIIKEELAQVLSEQEGALPSYFMPKHAAAYVVPYMQEESLEEFKSLLDRFTNANQATSYFNLTRANDPSIRKLPQHFEYMMSTMERLKSNKDEQPKRARYGSSRGYQKQNLDYDSLSPDVKRYIKYKM